MASSNSPSELVREARRFGLRMLWITLTGWVLLFFCEVAEEVGLVGKFGESLLRLIVWLGVACVLTTYALRARLGRGILVAIICFAGSTTIGFAIGMADDIRSLDGIFLIGRDGSFQHIFRKLMFATTSCSLAFMFFLLIDALGKSNAQLAQANIELGSDVSEKSSELEAAHQQSSEREIQFHVLFNNLPDPCFLCDDDGLIVDRNRAALDAFGSPSEVRLGNVVEIPVESGHELGQLLRSIRDNTDAAPRNAVELKCATESGDHRLVECSAFPFQSGERAFLLVVARDVTEQRVAELALHQAHDLLEERVRRRTAELSDANESLRTEVKERRDAETARRITEDRLQLALNATHSSCWDVNLKTGELTNTLPGVEWLGYEPHEVVHSRDWWKQLIHPDDREIPKKALDDHLNGLSASYDCEYRIRGKSGEWFWTHDKGLVVERDEEGKAVRIVGTDTDVTVRKRMEEQLHSLREELASVSRQSTMGEMAAGLAHELNQPLAAIANYAFVARHAVEVGPSKSKHDLLDVLSRLEEQSIRAGDVIRRMRAFVGKSSQVPTATEVNPLIQDVVNLMTSDLKGTRIQLAFEFDGHLPHAMIDGIQIQQVVMNLVRNAIDAMEDPGEDHELVIRTGLADDGKIQVAVSDTGKGLPEDVGRDLFDSFVTTKDTGMGMGLAISRNIVESHGGRLWAEKNVPRGATFLFTLPPLHSVSPPASVSTPQ